MSQTSFFSFTSTIKSKLIISSITTAMILASTVGIGLYGLNKIEQRYEKADDANRLIKFIQSISIEEIEEAKRSPNERFDSISILIENIYRQLEDIKVKFQSVENDKLVDDIALSIKKYEASFDDYENIFVDVITHKNKMKRAAREVESILSDFRRQQKKQVRAVIGTGKDNVLEELREADAANRMIKYLLDARRDEKNLQIYNDKNASHDVINNINAIEKIAVKMKIESEKNASRLMTEKVLKELMDYKVAFNAYIINKAKQREILALMIEEREELEERIYRLRKDQKIEMTHDVKSAYALLFSGGGSAIVIVFIISILLIRFVLMPIKSITLAMHKIIDSDSVVNVKLKVEGDNEISELTRAFNRFSEKITDAINKVSFMSLQLTRGQKMEALGKLAAGIAHDFNNMLGIILGCTEILKEELHNDPVLLGYVGNIRRAGERNSELTKKLLDFSKKSDDYPEKCSRENINNRLCLIRDILTQSLTPRIELQYRLADKLSLVCINGGEFDDSVLNSVINSVQAMPEGGTITIKTSDVSINKDNEVLLDMPYGSYVRLSITDTGVGVPPHLLGKIFDPFFTTKKEMGTGLGLSQVHGFVERSNGYINIRSSLTDGTRLDIYFPEITHEQKPLVNNKSETDIVLTGDEKILIVDDNADLLNLNRLVLNKYGYNVTAVDSAKSALQELEVNQYDLLLTDIIMPEMNGYELAEKVQKKYPDLKILLMSGYTDTDAAIGLDLKITSALLKKPFKHKELLSEIRKLLAS